jgi:hypothetical protein
LKIFKDIMSGNNIYSTGWYSVSPAFAWWNFDAHRVAAIKARREAARIVEQDKQQKKDNSAKIAEGTISVYA